MPAVFIILEEGIGLPLKINVRRVQIRLIHSHKTGRIPYLSGVNPTFADPALKTESPLQPRLNLLVLHDIHGDFDRLDVVNLIVSRVAFIWNSCLVVQHPDIIRHPLVKYGDFHRLQQWCRSLYGTVSSVAPYYSRRTLTHWGRCLEGEDIGFGCLACFCVSGVAHDFS
ncbi:hypothetical protein P153DRAFT_3580 [Dothidotthia symphoricarpi CBS 119687]|uniref:Uncharacterized protein n=1 Tax=Dothidotthia symphoricarpi CBS 119687 TaxID=1392245 RepID=A0A6A6ATH8_9PLEO|nr:uncharacterized protein P153DRAFT_3580 [Dothidotthia symphoricarpi CBS 119687]KAF2134523.1 hypothetical protein P153DRAFT_3580 [Dothidotthia symphoricarpi CBS 119687]